jgi:hypothetical protein
MASARFSVALVMLIAAVASSNAGKLPVSAEPLLLHRLHAQKIIAVHEVRHRSIDGFDYVGLFGTFEVTWSFESWYHPEIILRKKRSDPDWSHAELFRSEQRIGPLFALPDDQFQKALVPWPRD